MNDSVPTYLSASIQPGNPAENTVGPICIGLLFNVLLLGILCAQTYIYTTTHNDKDRLWIAFYVYFLLLANVLHTAFIAADVYVALITHYNQPEYLSVATWLFEPADSAITGIVAGAVQLFFSWRVRTLTRNTALGIIMALISMASTVAAFAVSYVMPEAVPTTRFKYIICVWLGAACIADVMITTSLVLYLKKHKTGIEGSDALVDRVIRMSIQTGMITSICAIINLSLYLALPTGQHFIFNLALAKLYTNMLLSSLNSRAIWSKNDGMIRQSKNLSSFCIVLPDASGVNSQMGTMDGGRSGYGASSDA
ncbi:hypothetical protein CYLTODRAFT_453685 [Cylindrobasidium torrendii FP15055 ss-10]|uniref:DUF6534 domain-containing protein n=1 Tax=Cylindrobasidium torrendii FP15055 ss-10 TaxID=1314674 RepID=A0A0D7BF71_9AGAR|nr:hypothetical protein CYLTODRAFT_453685 [Cylindrobasidium torrendii FP15055 ss-10]